MTYRCARCGCVVDDTFAARNKGSCYQDCGGRLAPVASAGPSALDGLDPGSLPYPVALTAGRLAAALDGAADPCRAVFLLKDGFEAAVKYLGSVLLAEYLRGPARTPDRDSVLLEKLIRPSLGVWVNVVLGDLGRWLAGGPDPGGAVAALFARPPARPGGKPTETELFAECGEFVKYRNDVLGHGATRPDAAYAADLARWLPVLRRLLDGVAGLAAWRLCLVADVDRCQVWVGERPGPGTEPGSFPRGLVGKFVLRGPGGEVRPLDPFVWYAADPDRDRRLHFFDSVYRYTAARKELALLEYDEGFKRVSPDPVPALEEAFTADLLAAAFGRHRGKMAVIEGRVANFGELIEAHAGIVGRRFAIDRVRRFVAENDRGLLVITGEPGRGKTALTAHLLDEVFGHYSPPPVHFFYRRTAGITDPDVCVRSLYHALLEAHGLTESEESKRQTDPEAAARKLDDLLANHVGPKLLPSRPQLIFVDALDEADPTPTGRTAFQRLPAELPAGVYVIATTRPVADRSTLARRPHLHWFDLDSPDFEQDHLRDGREYVERELVGLDLPEEARSALAAAGAGNFLVLRLLCARVRDGLTAAGVGDLLRRLATDGAEDRLGFIYGEFWGRLTDRLPREELQLVADAAGALAWAKAPLTAELLCRALGRPAAEVERAVRRLAEYLTAARYEDGAEETFYRLYHESFADFLRARLSADRDRLAGALADFCRRWADLPDGYARTYALRFGPTHLRELARWDDLEGLLTDWRFLEAKTEAGYVFELAADLEAGADALPADRPAARLMRLIRAAILPEIRFIAEHPATLFQCAWNTGWWHGGPLAAWLEGWRAGHTRPWFRSVRPPLSPLHDGRVWLLPLTKDDGPLCVAFCPDGSRLAVGCRDGAVREWDVAGRRELRRLAGHAESVQAVCYSPDGSRLAAGYADGTLRVWDAVTGADTHTCRLDDAIPTMRENGFVDDPRGWVREGVHDLAVAGDTLCAVYGHRASKHLIAQLYNLGEGGVGWLRWERDSSAGAVFPATERVAIAGKRGWMLMWEPAVEVSGIRDAEGFTLTWRGQLAHCVRFAPDGGRVVAGSEDRTARVWDLATREELWGTGDLGAVVGRLAVAADGTVAAGTEGADGAVVLLDGGTGAVRARLPGHPGGVSGVAVTADGRMVASAGRDGLARVTETGSGLAPSAAAHPWPVTRVAVSPDGVFVAIAFRDGTLGVWQTAGGRSVTPTPRHLGPVTSLVFSDDSGALLSSSEDGTARVWDPRTGGEVARSGDPVDRTPLQMPHVDLLRHFDPGYRDYGVSAWFADGGRVVEFVLDGQRFRWAWARGEPPAAAAASGPPADPSNTPAPAGRWVAWDDSDGVAVSDPGVAAVAWCPVRVRPGPAPGADHVWVGHTGNQAYIFVLEQPFGPGCESHHG